MARAWSCVVRGKLIDTRTDQLVPVRLSTVEVPSERWKGQGRYPGKAGKDSEGTLGEVERTVRYPRKGGKDS